MISVDKLYELFVDTLSHLEERKSNLSDKDLSISFEDLESDAFSFMHHRNIKLLIDAKKIPTEIQSDILEIRTQILKEMETTNSIEQFRSDTRWVKIRNKVNILKEKITHHNTGYTQC